MNTVMHRIGSPLPRSSLFAAPGLFPPDGKAILRRRAADRAMCRRLGTLPAIIASVRDDSAIYRAHLALAEHTAANVAAALIVWHRRNTTSPTKEGTT